MEPINQSEVRRLELLDANCRLGPSDLTISGSPTTVPELAQEMDRLGIAQALVYHASAAGYDPEFGNAQLMKELRATSRMRACWVVMPHHTGEMENPGTLLPRMLAAGACAVRIFPTLHRFSIAGWSVDELLGELNDHRIPLFLDFGRSHWAEEVVDYDGVARICREFPSLPVVLVREGIGSVRYIYPLLECFENLLLELSYYQPSGGVADICRRFGAGRLLFGTGLPAYSGGPAISMLYFADISFQEKKRVGGDNLRNLLLAVK
jgi:predicted TIM-barrel fold metal-dependent hydrolase